MTADEIKELKKGILLTAKYYGRDLPGEVITMMADDLSDLGFSDVLNAYTLYRRDPKNRSMPLPAQIREIIQPVVNPTAQAREIVERIKHAITKFGYASGLEAHRYIGDIGWNVVRRSGGWHAVCESDIFSNSSRQAQMRDSIADQITYGANLIPKTEFKLLPFKPDEHYEIEDAETKRINKLELEKSKQLMDFMEKFGAQSDLIKEGK